MEHGDRAVNVAALMARLEGDRELLAELVTLYVEDEAGQLAELERAVERRDAEAVRRAAHALKGVVSNFSAPFAEAAAFALEMAGRHGQLSSAPALVATLRLELGRVRDALMALCAGPA